MQIVEDARELLAKCDHLLGEFAPHTLDDTEGTVEVFSYSEDLVCFMRENDVDTPTEARDLLHYYIFDCMDDIDELDN